MSRIKLKKMKLSQIEPYWRNPRNNEAAVQPVMDSIKRYGYIQPIVVDLKNVIITGHTRYKALQRLEIDEVDVIEMDLPPEKAKEYRLVDNKTSEFASWNENLIPELREFLDYKVFFPEIDISDAAGANYQPPTQEEIDKIQQENSENFKNTAEGRSGNKIKMICPECGEEYYVSIGDVERAIAYAKEGIR